MDGAAVFFCNSLGYRESETEAGKASVCGRTEGFKLKFFVMEAYVDEDAFQTHLGMPYGGPFNARLEEIIEEPHSILTFLDKIA